MKTVTYKGFQAAVEYEDGTLFVRVLHVEDLLVTQCKSVDEIEPALKELIDDYLQDCKELGKEPSKAFSGSFNVRVGPDLHRKAAVAAAERGCNLNAWLIEAVSEKLECDRLGSRVDTVFAGAREEIQLLRMTSLQLSSGHHHAIRAKRTISRQPDATPVIANTFRRVAWAAKLDG